MNKILCTLTLAVSAVSYAARAESQLNEIEASSTLASFYLSGDYSHAQVSAGYNYLITESVQIGGKFGWEYISAKDSTDKTTTGSVFSLLLGPTINYPFGENLNESFFTMIALGFMKADDALTRNGSQVNIGSGTKFAFYVDFGKRFLIWNNCITLKPSVAIQKVEGLDVAFILTPFALSYLF
ncbi:MAG: hypothetical protein JST16_16615 [Bdellovibrionales bacterium]|nr:hypothetical protein [Bdellovibrionales bacterium]